jgi:hypothetical protein
MYTILRHCFLTSLLFVVGALGVQSSASAACGEAHCTEVSSFKAVVTDFRISQSRNVRIATATLRVMNKTDRPLVLGYVQGSGVVIDDQGNRYEVDTRDANNVRAIGVITSRTFDPKFSLQPGASGDARLQFSWYAGKQIAGTVFQLELTIREIDSVAGNQFKLGREHAVQFRSLTDGLASENAQSLSSVPGGAVQTGAVQTGAAPTAVTTSNPDIADPCAGMANCSSAGLFTAQVTQLTASQVRNVHLVRINMRFRNITNQPLILAYTTNSGSMIDNYGNRYTVDSRAADHVKGIGQTSRNKADPQFVLSPGESRNATFEYTRYIGKTAIGTVFTPDLAIERLEILPSQQIRSVREFSLSFANLSAGTMVAEAGDAANSVTSISEAGKQLSEGLKSLFKKK